MREVEPGDIEAGADQLTEDRFTVAGRAKGGDDLGPAALVRGRRRARFHQGKTHSSPILRSGAGDGLHPLNSTRTFRGWD